MRTQRLSAGLDCSGPVGSFNGTTDPEGAEAGLHVARELGARGLAFLHLSEPDWAGGQVLDEDYRRALREAHPGPIVGAGNYDRDKAERLLRAGLVDAAAFGRSFIANPDLVIRMFLDAPLTPANQETFYGGAEQGYTDYPILRDAAHHACFSDASGDWG